MTLGIYEIVHLPSGKRYIGSSTNVADRLAGHRRTLKRGAHSNFRLQRAWNKHGADAFAFRVVEYLFGTVEEMVAIEQQHIDRVEQMLRYNRRPDASSNAGIKMPPTTDAVRRFRAEMARNRIRTPEERAKISASLTGRKNGPHSAETRRKIGLIHKGRVTSEETRRKQREKAKGRKLPERTPEIDAKIKVALRAAWVRRKARQLATIALEA